MDHLKNKLASDKEYLIIKYNVENIDLSDTSIKFDTKDLSWNIHKANTGIVFEINGFPMAQIDEKTGELSPTPDLIHMEKLIRLEEYFEEKQRGIDPVARKLLKEYTSKELSKKYIYYLTLYEEAISIYTIYKEKEKTVELHGKLVGKNSFEHEQKKYNITNMYYDFNYVTNTFITTFTITYPKITLDWKFESTKFGRFAYIQATGTEYVLVYHQTEFTDIDIIGRKIPLSILNKFNGKEILTEYNKLYKFFEQMISRFEFQDP